ncbi:MAG: transglycosylase SLT domain-containing protein [Clostridia bacterium]|nr:transglycosylase SLT domain-containing protein [Clostridia bacterium]MDD4386256.1 transglycosylase SLT domain-containing protein [Clostridia bacterium]
MKEDKAHVLRKTLVIITVMLIFITAGISLVAMQVKTVTFNYFGDIKIIKTLSTNVESFLIQNKIKLNDDIIVSPSKDTKIVNNIEIKIYSAKKVSKIDAVSMYAQYTPIVAKIIEVSEAIPFEEEKIDNPAINRGVTKISKEGSNGEKITKYLVKYSGETEIYKVALNTDTKIVAQNKVIEVGTKLSPVISRTAPIIIPTVDSGFKSYNIKLPVDQQQYAYSMCQNYGIQYELLLAVIYKESGYNPNSIGGGNSYGLCQIHISNHTNLRNRLGISDFLDPYDNIKAGAYMLSLYMNSGRKASSEAATIEVYALNSYNMGEGNYFSNCYSQGIVDRSYSNSVISIRNRLINNGGL